MWRALLALAPEIAPKEIGSQITPHSRGTTMQKFVVVSVDVAIMILICVSLFSGKPAFKTKGTAVLCGVEHTD
jgi:hypothetical protein